jgi:drug/metabolite transporter (DMT)-like permease
VTGVSLAVGVGLICALLSALGTNLAFLFKHRGAVAAPDVDMHHPLRSAADLFRSRWWSIGWGVAAVAFGLHVAALALAPISIGQAMLAGGLVFLAVLAERFFGFELGRRQWAGIGLVAVSLSVLTLTGGRGGEGAHSHYSLAGLIVFEGVVVCAGAVVVFSHLVDRISVQRGVLLGIAAGLGFGGVAVIAVTSVAANLSTIVAGLAVFGDRLGTDALVVGGRVAAFVLILVGSALIPAPVRARAAIGGQPRPATPGGG